MNAEEQARSDAAFLLINAIHQQGAVLRDMITELRANGAADPRWVAIGETHLQQGLMALVRAVQRPDNF